MSKSSLTGSFSSSFSGLTKTASKTLTSTSARRKNWRRCETTVMSRNEESTDCQSMMKLGSKANLSMQDFDDSTSPVGLSWWTTMISSHHQKHCVIALFHRFELHHKSTYHFSRDLLAKNTSLQKWLAIYPLLKIFNFCVLWSM